MEHPAIFAGNDEITLFLFFQGIEKASQLGTTVMPIFSQNKFVVAISGPMNNNPALVLLLKAGLKIVILLPASA